MGHSRSPREPVRPAADEVAHVSAPQTGSRWLRATAVGDPVVRRDLPRSHMVINLDNSLVELYYILGIYSVRSQGHKATACPGVWSRPVGRCLPDTLG